MSVCICVSMGTKFRLKYLIRFAFGSRGVFFLRVVRFVVLVFGFSVFRFFFLVVFWGLSGVGEVGVGVFGGCMSWFAYFVRLTKKQTKFDTNGYRIQYESTTKFYTSGIQMQQIWWVNISSRRFRSIDI